MTDLPKTPEGLTKLGTMLAAAPTCEACGRGFLVEVSDVAMVTCCPFCRAPLHLLKGETSRVQ